MIPSLRNAFNLQFTPEKYASFLRHIDQACGTHVHFRLSETPFFLPKALVDQMAEDGKELIRQLVDTPAYHARSETAIPAEFKVPNESPHPMFIQVDFGLVRGADGNLQPKLVELQAFPSLYAYQPTLAQAYIDVYGLDGAKLRYFLSGLDNGSYRELLGRAIVAGHDPQNVVLMEVDPLHQKTFPDFALTEKMLGIPTIDIARIRKNGREL
ncbi:MAG TPA: hypothetical protein VND65_09660, partial [Candidatus Binatia bacterium]|nr:hypothetical protein [Candidatus Binatia bacterium]